MSENYLGQEIRPFIKSPHIGSVGVDVTAGQGGGPPLNHASTHAAGGSDPVTLTTAQITDLAEFIRDTIAGALVAGSNVTITVDDPGNTITIASTGGGGGGGTDPEVVRDTIAAALIAGTSITITPDDAANTITIASTIDAEFIRDTIGATLVAGSNTTVTVDDGANTITIASSGGGAVSSVDGQTGAVLLESTYVQLDDFPVALTVALSDETTQITGSITTPKVRLRAPFGFTLTEVRASLSTADTTLTTFDIHGDGDTTILGTKLTIDANEKTSESAATPATITGATIADDSELSLYVDSIGTAARGAKITLIGVRSLTPTGLPGPVQSLAGTPSTTSVALTWSAPASNGGSAITDYEVQWSVANQRLWTTFSDGTSATTGATVTGLNGATTYDFRVRAITANGPGPWVEIERTTSGVATVPGVPQSVVATPGNTQVVLTWNAPASNGGAAITDYIVQYKESVSGTWLTFSDGTSATTGATVTGLTNGTAYDFRVAAVNSVGTGNYAGVVTATPGTVPAQVGTVTPTAGNSQVTLAWSAPANGGAAITDYEVEQSLNGSTGWVTAAGGSITSVTGQTVTGLTNGTAYYYRVRAVNIFGAGAWSAVAGPVTPAGAGLGPGTHVLNPTIYKYIQSRSEVNYTEARAGTATKNVLPSSGDDVYVGQIFDGVDPEYFDVYQVFLEFDTTIASGTLSSATLKVMGANFGNVSDTDFVIRAAHEAWGTTVETTDFVPGADLASRTVAASRDTSTMTWGSPTLFALTNSGNVLRDGINTSGKTRLLLWSSRQQSGSAPASGDNYEYVVLDGAVCELELVIS